MKRADRRRWAAARDLQDLGELTAQWCAGRVAQTPGHAGGPCRETLPYLDLLAAVNRAGFVTENSQAAGHGWTAWVCGFAGAETSGRLVAAMTAAGMTVEDLMPDGQQEVRYLYERGCPGAAAAIRTARLIWIEDPEPGRNSLLWPALAKFAGLTAVA